MPPAGPRPPSLKPPSALRPLRFHRVITFCGHYPSRNFAFRHHSSIVPSSPITILGIPLYKDTRAVPFYSKGVRVESVVLTEQLLQFSIVADPLSDASIKINQSSLHFDPDQALQPWHQRGRPSLPWRRRMDMNSWGRKWRKIFSLVTKLLSVR